MQQKVGNHSGTNNCQSGAGSPDHCDLNAICHCCPLTVVVDDGAAVVVVVAGGDVVVHLVAVVVAAVARVDGVVAKSCEGYLKTFRTRYSNPL